VETALIAATGPVISLDPDGAGQNDIPSFSAYLAGYDGLVIYRWPLSQTATKSSLAKGATQLVRPALATRWETAARGKIYRFHLRRGVKSQYGNELSADDVIWSIHKSLASKTSGAFLLQVVGGVAGPDSIKAIDARTVELTLQYPTDWILFALGFYIGG